MIVYFDELGLSCISVDDIKRRHGDGKFEKFCKWMNGQTIPLIEKNEVVKLIPQRGEWVYWHDYARWAKGLSVID